MNHWLKRLTVVLLAAAGLTASFLAARALKEAIVASEDLYRIDTAGLQIESALEYDTQESRRAFLYAVALTDPNEQLPHVDQARVASDRVHESVRQLYQLGSPEIAKCAGEFERSWKIYGEARDEVVAHILEGNTRQAVLVERQRGQQAFLAALHDLRELRSSVTGHAGRQSAQVHSTLRRCAEGLSAFTICTVLIVALLSKLNRDRRNALEKLHSTNAALAAQTAMEERRAAILEMVGTHKALSHTLATIVELAPRSDARSGAAVWAAAGTDLHFQIAANLPDKFVSKLSERGLPRAEECSQLLVELDIARREIARGLGLQSTEAKALRDASGRLIGMLQGFSPLGIQYDHAVLEQMAQLAAVAIENTLLYERLAFQAQHDMLTNLPNRLAFQDRLQQAIALSGRHNKKLAVLWVDLDRYKQVNDTLGHRVGDEVLCEVARRLKNCLRKSDTVARVGGDEFTVLVHDVNTIADAELVAAKILRALARPMLLGEHEVAITASAGISVFPDHGDEPVLLMRDADLAMYNAKRSGGNTFHLFLPSLADSLARRVDLERELRNALDRDEFYLEYQPLMRADGKLTALEALIRWTNPILGRVPPMDFIPIAEEMGMIAAIGEWVMRAACRDGAYWMSIGLDVPRIAVNVSTVQLVGKGFGSMVLNACRNYRFPTNKIEVEITETALMNNLDQAMEQIVALRKLGVRFSIDDFGTGYSSLSQLRTLPVDCLKIDRAFIKELEPAGSGCSTLVQGIITLAHSLQLEVVAEGIETVDQLNLLRRLGCDIFQGFYLARPLQAHAVEELLKQPDRSVEAAPVLIPTLA